MNIITISIFPKILKAFLKYGIISKIIKKKLLNIKNFNIRNFSKKIDDHPIGGGDGMIITYRPINKAVIKAKKILKTNTKTIYLSPQGDIFNQKNALRLSKKKNLILICGRYKGIDERAIKQHVDEEISIGNYILSGGEVPAMVLIESIARLIPNSINHKSLFEDSIIKKLSGCPYYTQPTFIKKSKTIPKILLSGNYKKIKKWKYQQRIIRTLIRGKNILKKQL